MEKQNTFHGRHFYKVDLKGRVPFPSVWFLPLDLKHGESMILARGVSPDSKFLELYSPKGWKEKMDAVESSFPEGKLKNNFIRWYVSTAESLELDTQNRVRLPKHLMEYAGLEKDVVLLGCVDRIEIWAKDSLKESETLSEDDFDAVFDFLNAFKEKKQRVEEE